MRRECYWMISKYVKEQKRYTQDELRKIFECTADETVQIIRKLKEYGIVKNVKKSDRQSMLSDLVEEDIKVTDIESGERELYYVFSFVGVIVVYGRVLKCYPKYINSCGSPVAQMKQIMRVLEKYNSKEQVIKLYNESDDGGSFNLLAVMLYLLQDYYDNGIYANDVDIVETNGTGEILWDRTINETFSYISNNRPYYTELQTKKRTSDEYDFIRRFYFDYPAIEIRDFLEFFKSNINLCEEVLDDNNFKESLDLMLYLQEFESNLRKEKLSLNLLFDKDIRRIINSENRYILYPLRTVKKICCKKKINFKTFMKNYAFDLEDNEKKETDLIDILAESKDKRFMFITSKFLFFPRNYYWMYKMYDIVWRSANISKKIDYGKTIKSLMHENTIFELLKEYFGQNNVYANVYLKRTGRQYAEKDFVVFYIKNLLNF